jgi:nitric oxide reductase NorD protein
MNPENPLYRLFLADPELASGLHRDLEACRQRLSGTDGEELTECLIHCLSQNRAFGEAVAGGATRLVQQDRQHHLSGYLEAVTRYGREGATIGTLMAEHLAPVLCCGEKDLYDDFLAMVAVLDGKGTYILPPVLAAVSQLLAQDDRESARRFIRLCRIAFDQELSYNACQHLSHTLPAAAIGFHRKRRAYQTDALAAVACTSSRFVEPFLDGLAAGAATLAEPALRRFVAMGLKLAGDSREKALSFLSLRSCQAQTVVQELQVAVSLAEVAPRLARYVRARTGRALRLAPLRSGKDGKRDGLPVHIRSDAATLYLPEEIELFDNREQNREIYDHLVRLEVGYHEFGTFDFDLGRLMDHYPEYTGDRVSPDQLQEDEPECDMVRFFHLFPSCDLARELFTLFEHARQGQVMRHRYPGLAGRLAPIIHAELVHNERQHPDAHLLQQLYTELVPAALRGEGPATAGSSQPEVSGAVALFTELSAAAEPPVEMCGALVCAVYSAFEKSCCSARDDEGRRRLLLPFCFPFGRRLRPSRFLAPVAPLDHRAGDIRRQLAVHDVHLSRTTIRHRLQEQGGRLTEGDLADLLQPSPAQGMESSDVAVIAGSVDLASLLDPDRSAEPVASSTPDGQVYWYHEWDHRLGDYLNDHTRVLDKSLGPVENGFYARTLLHHGGLIRRIRRSFELLKPEGLSMLRQWIEGDEFDYRALVDFAVDRRMKRVPSDRLYIKRIKQERDVAVQLLVDLSRSTANRVQGTRQSVLDVEKQALVLFCEALEVVGDAYALAGFSGTGRLGVDYVRIKDFDDRLDDTVHGRINALLPMRSTRMGAAIRHAVSCIGSRQAKVRLLIVIGDGFPNDVNYKRAYAVADTRKAIAEARTQSIYTHAITVNMNADSRLDEVYGSLHHNVISDVRDLPDKLIRIYSRLTRN